MSLKKSARDEVGMTSNRRNVTKWGRESCERAALKRSGLVTRNENGMTVATAFTRSR